VSRASSPSSPRRRSSPRSPCRCTRRAPSYGASCCRARRRSRRASSSRAPRELVEAALDYSRGVGHPLQIQWTLLAGVNDGDEELSRLAGWLAGARVIVNLIPYNATDGAQRWARPATERTVELVRGLRRAGVAATIRRSGGADVDGACGQLRARLAPTGA
jgi:23S rRNA (adenine2503-C2)-methyltransferase